MSRVEHIGMTPAVFTSEQEALLRKIIWEELIEDKLVELDPKLSEVPRERAKLRARFAQTSRGSILG